VDIVAAQVSARHKWHAAPLLFSGTARRGAAPESAGATTQRHPAEASGVEALGRAVVPSDDEGLDGGMA